MDTKITPIALACTWFVASLACAQQVTENQPQQLPDVRITAQKLQTLPQPAAVLNSSDLQAKRAFTSDTASLMQDVAGVSVLTNGGTSSFPSIRGLSDDRLRITVDGMDMIAACPNHMNTPLSYLDPTSIEEIEVFSGVTPVSVGGDSLGGTIQVKTKAPLFAPSADVPIVKGQLGTFYKSNGQASGVNAQATYASDRLSMTYMASTAQSGNYVAGGNFKTSTSTGRNDGSTLGLNEVGSSAYKTRNQLMSLAMRGDKDLIEAKVGLQDTPYQLYPNQRMDMTGNNEARGSLRYLGQKDWGMLEARVYRELVDHSMDFGPNKVYWYGSSFNVAGMPMLTQSNTNGANIKADMELTPTDVVRVGANYELYALNDWWPPVANASMMMSPNTFTNINHGTRERVGVFSEWERQLAVQWTSLLGVRMEQIKENTNNVQGYSSMYATDASAFNLQNKAVTDQNYDLTALIRHKPTATSVYELGYARKTRSPNLYEHYSWSTNSMAAIMNNFVGDGNGYVGNVNLKPEVAHTINVSADWQDAYKTQGLRVAPFYTYVENYVDATCNTTCTANQFNVLKYTNQSAHIQGVDLSGYQDVARNEYGFWRVNGLLNYVYAVNGVTGSGLYNTMPINARLSLSQKVGAWSNSLEAVLVGAKTNVSQVRNEMQTAGYAVANLRMSYAWQEVRADFGVENLFDRFYQNPVGGAYLGQGKTMSMNAANIPWGTQIPGMGRSLYAGLTYKF